ncbi:MAG: hypothetical protein JXQ67_01265 [Campylobacterales bacterium]|nr:hypothetical protein [Campylobacterales bacterium]
MVNIDWDEYKEYKQFSIRSENFEILLDFLKSYYNLVHPSDMFETMQADDIAQMMLEKRDIYDAASLENYLRNY